MTTESHTAACNAAQGEAVEKAIDTQDAAAAPIDSRNGVADKPFFHIYILRPKGDAFFRVNTYSCEPGSQEGARPAAWESRHTARYWGRKISEGRRHLILLCPMEPGTCPVCRKVKQGKAYDDNSR